MRVIICQRIVFGMLFAFLSIVGTEVCAADPGEDYKIGPEDLLKINVFDHPELSLEARVSKSGNVTFPLLGVVHVADLSARRVEEELVQRLEAGAYVRRPQVSVLIAEYQSQKVAVLGQVLKPGQYALTKANHVLDLLAQAGGVVNESAADHATLLRVDAAKQQIDLHRLFEGDPAQNPSVTAGDTIYVPKAPVFYIYGEVQRAGMYRLERDMTVMQAISTGGGLTRKGSKHFMKVERRDDKGAMHVVSVNSRDLLKPDDVLRVPESWF